MKVLTLLMCFFGARAMAFEVGPVGVYSFYNMTSVNVVTGTQNLSYSPSGDSGFGGGLASVFSLSNEFDLEVRAYYVDEHFKMSFSGTSSGMAVTGSTKQDGPFFQIPVFLNLRLGKFGIHGGGFFALATGNTSSTASVTFSGTTTTSNSSSANTINDYGAAGGLEFRTDLSPSTSLLISADYYYGLANQTAGTAGASSSTSQAIQGVAGFLFKL